MNKRSRYNQILVLLFFIAAFNKGIAQQTVSAQKMQEIYDEVKTPYKYGLVVTPENDTKKIDCPSVFRKGKNWYMTWIQFDGSGDETWLSKRRDLLHWTTLGKIMRFSDTSNVVVKWDANQKDGYTAVQDRKREGRYEWKK